MAGFNRGMSGVQMTTMTTVPQLLPNLGVLYVHNTQIVIGIFKASMLPFRVIFLQLHLKNSRDYCFKPVPKENSLPI